MLFNSWQFAVFLPIVFFVYYALNDTYRWIFLLGASYFFYMSWNPKLVVLIAGTTLISYFCAIRVEETPDRRGKKGWMLLGLLTSLAILFFFKYYNFFAESAASILRLFSLPARDLTLNLILPVGISFYTFQTLSYVIDVYRGELRAERHLGYYALYVIFFPQLVAGPIERPGNLIPQLREKTVFSYENVTKGMKIMAWGYFKKMVLASYLSVYVDKIYDHPQDYPGFALVLATIFFSIQIYCDFSGYSDIAIGSAKLFGKDLMLNFKSPYFSGGIKEFWSRWHISLSSWFRDYVYIPLGGNRVSFWRHKLNLMITFMASGLWHGANWTFVIWGGLHGFFQVAESIWNRWFPKNKEKKEFWLVGGIKRTATFLLVSFAWIFFRANTIGDALFVVRNMFRNIRYFIPYLREGYDFLGLTKAKLVGLLIPLALLFVYDYYDRKTDVIDRISSLPAGWRWLIYVVFVSGMICWVAASFGTASQEFIYFQF